MGIPHLLCPRHDRAILVRVRRWIALVSAGVVAGCGGGADASDETIARAKEAYAAAKAQGVDMSRGPCLGEIEPGWVADVAHDPREDVDDEPENQCAAYRTGQADHFVELDPDGEFIRSG
jgi:hypothetical protein